MNVYDDIGNAKARGVSTLRARWEAEREKEAIQRAYYEHKRNAAQTLLNAGYHIIPSEVLTGNQVMVSREMYDTVKQIMRGD